MLFEVYYKNYAKNCKGKYWEEEKSLPYIVLERDVKKEIPFMDIQHQGVLNV